MTIKRFETLLKRVNPKLRIRQKGFGDVGGIFVGLSGKTGYIARMSKGELHMNGFRHVLVDPENPMGQKDGFIKKRGRKTLIMLMRNWRWIKTHKQKSMLMYGLGR